MMTTKWFRRQELQRQMIADPTTWLGGAQRARKELEWRGIPRRFLSLPTCKINVGPLFLIGRIRRLAIDYDETSSLNSV
jgi:hypothetical protein